LKTFSIKVINHSGIQIVIKNLPTIFGHMAIKGEDEQLETAVKELLKEIDSKK